MNSALIFFKNGCLVSNYLKRKYGKYSIRIRTTPANSKTCTNKTNFVSFWTIQRKFPFNFSGTKQTELTKIKENRKVPELESCLSGFGNKREYEDEECNAVGFKRLVFIAGDRAL